jgi:hypothetical protein
MAPKLATAHDIKIATASYGPAALKAMGLAFDQAWEEIAGHFDPGGQQSQIMRLRLAKALLEVAIDSSRDVAALKNEALQILATDYRTGAASVMALARAK